MKKSYFIISILVAAVFLLMLAVNYYTDYLWYDSMGAAQVFVRPFVTEWAIKAGLFVLGFAFVAANLLPLAGRLKVQRLRVVDGMEVQRSRGIGRKVMLAISAGLSLFWVWVVPSVWERVLLFINSQPVGQLDPVLGRDISFYFFTYPLLTLVSGAFLGLLLLTIAAVVVGYIVAGAIETVSGRLAFSGKSTAHLSILAGLFLVWFALSRELAMAGLLVSPSQSVFGAGYTDIHIRLPFMRIQQGLAGLLALAVFVNMRRGSRLLLAAVPAVLVVASIVGGLVAGAYQQFIVGPNQLVRETPYIAHHIEATRHSYNLHNIEVLQYEVDEEQTLSRAVLERHQATLDNIRLLDYRPLKEHYHQGQSLRLYYEFNDIDIDRYWVEGQYRQVMLSARELNVESLPEQAQTLINRHFKYTHGYGVVMSPVNRLTSNGHPTYFLRDIPVRSEVGIEVNRPEIYFGELTNQFVVVNTKGGEFSYQEEGVEEQIIRYQGKDGVQLTGFRRLLYALKFQKPILLLSDEITSESRILYNRNIRERISMLAPFLRLDNDPYIVVADGRLYWIMDAYTVSSYYPYSQPISGGTNYVRNSVKVVVDAYEGTVDFYRFDDDPIIAAWQGVFPGLIKERHQFPSQLESHIRYPLDLFDVQASILKTYHMTNPQDFYNRENVWEIAVEKYRRSEVEVEPYYVTMEMPGGEAPEFVLMLPFTPYNRNNMVGWLAAGNDGDNYGKLWLYQFPRGTLVDGPSQVEAYIDQDPNISQQISLWDRGGSEVLRGNLLTIPLEGVILYVEPLYILAETRSVPELRRVIIFSDNILVMEESLELALEKLMLLLDEDMDPDDIIGPGQPGDIIDPDLRNLVEEILRTYEDMQQSARDGRWADYGDYGDKLEELLEQLEQTIKDAETE